jgi:hypothetical protein
VAVLSRGSPCLACPTSTALRASCAPMSARTRRIPADESGRGGGGLERGNPLRERVSADHANGAYGIEPVTFGSLGGD